MAVTLTVFFNTNMTTFTEMFDSVETAADMVNDIAYTLGAELRVADLSTFGHQGWLYRDHPAFELVGDYNIEEH